MTKIALFILFVVATVNLSAQSKTYTNTIDTTFNKAETKSIDTINQDNNNLKITTLLDSLDHFKASNSQLTDSLSLFREKADSVYFVLKKCHKHNLHLLDSVNNYQVECDSLNNTINRLRRKNEILHPLNQELSLQIKNLQTKVDSQSSMLDQQIQKIKEKEQLFKEKELIYKNAIQETKIDLVKLEGQLHSKNSEISGKEREIELLAESISERKEAIKQKNREIELIRYKRESAKNQIDTLRDYLKETQLSLALTKEKLKYTNKEVAALKKKIENMTKKDKKIRIIQGVGIRNFRNPQYSLHPESSQNPDSYVISNENAGEYEFDFITGASFKLIDLNKEDAKFKSDAGFFVGFGGKNLFKNFYIGPNIKLFDVIHINAGINIAEFKVLKSGFNEGDAVDQGASIPTVSQWKISPYFGLTFDLSLITSIAGKL